MKMVTSWIVGTKSWTDCYELLFKDHNWIIGQVNHKLLPSREEGGGGGGGGLEGGNALKGNVLKGGELNLGVGGRGNPRAPMVL